MKSEIRNSKSEIAPSASRRSFVAAVAAIVTGGLAALAPVGAGLATFFSPLFRRSKPAQVRVALLDQVPDDGLPRFFPVLADRVDAWNRQPAQRIGAVYLVREKGAKEPVAFTAKCPHAGCFIGYTAGEDAFKCPCHTSSFKLDGTRLRGDAEVSPRDMDKLKVELRGPADAGESAGGGLRMRRRRRRGRGAPDAPDDDDDNSVDVIEVWVEFVDFETGRKEQIRTA
jgi:Rieske Fe-S protein